MSKRVRFDVLIVYNSDTVNSPADLSTCPFTLGSPNESCNAAYAYFLHRCAVLKLQAALCSSADITGAGSCKSYWSYQNKSWQKHFSPCYAPQIFDRFSPKSPRTVALRNLLFSSSSVKSFNSYSLFKLFFDKQKTYAALSSFAIPTVTLTDRSTTGIIKSCRSLRKLVEMGDQRDFTDQLILKDRFGAGGVHIYKFESGDYHSIAATLASNPHISFVIQPLLKFDHGFKFKNKYVSTDIRLIYLQGQIVSSYIRIAKSGDFRCNQHQGASLAYLHKSMLPKAVLQAASQIERILNKNTSLFTLDFLMTNSGNAYLLEGNTGPGLSWDPNDHADQAESKLLIRRITGEISRRRPCDLPAYSHPPRPNFPIVKTNILAG